MALISSVINKSVETKRIPYKHTNYNLLRKREMGFKTCMGESDDLARKIYSNLGRYDNEFSRPDGYVNGAIFNLEFSLDGSLLVAACEEKSIMIYDAFNQKMIQQVDNAHEKCVNCVRFINDNTFATCSDDGIIKIWDTRHLAVWKRALHGHTNWVKNIEYAERDNMMITSAFDGTICGWDLNQPSDHIVEHEKLLVMNSLMRTKLSPDNSKMIIATTSGFMMVIHDLNLQTLFRDTGHFKPVFYRLMQLSEQSFPTAQMFNRLFSHSRKRNRIEFIDDFPNEAEIISSLQIHPQGWCALSRNANGYDNMEYTCVHDIQTRPADAYTYTVLDPDADGLPADISSYLVSPPSVGSNSPEQPENRNNRLEQPQIPAPQQPTNRQQPTEPQQQPQRVRENDAVGGDAEPEGDFLISPFMGSDIWLGFVTQDMRRQRHLGEYRPHVSTISSGLFAGENTSISRYFERYPEDRQRIVKNVPRMTHYKQELNAGQGFIKELCFSTDGRLICSPYDNGIRIMGFNDQLQELCYCVPEDKPRELYTLSHITNLHKQVVVCCKFNPRHHELVSGCLGGDIMWYRPIL